MLHVDLCRIGGRHHDAAQEAFPLPPLMPLSLPLWGEAFLYLQAEYMY